MELKDNVKHYMSSQTLCVVWLIFILQCQGHIVEGFSISTIISTISIQVSLQNQYVVNGGFTSMHGFKFH